MIFIISCFFLLSFILVIVNQFAVFISNVLMQTFRGSMLARLLACLLARLLVVCELRTGGIVRITKNSVGTKGPPAVLLLGNNIFSMKGSGVCFLSLSCL